MSRDNLPGQVQRQTLGQNQEHHPDPPRFTQIHPDSPRFTQIRVDSPRFTQIHSDSPRSPVTCHLSPHVGGKKSFENSQIQESKNLQISQNSGRVKNLENPKIPNTTVPQQFTVPNSRYQKTSTVQIHGLTQIHGPKFTVSEKHPRSKFTVSHKSTVQNSRSQKNTHGPNSRSQKIYGFKKIRDFSTLRILRFLDFPNF
jgi:hypothetical protein